MPVAIAAFVVLGAFGGIEWIWHRNPTVPAKAVESKVSNLVRSPANQSSDPLEVSTDSGRHFSTQTQIGRDATLQDPGVGLRPVPTAASATQATAQDGGRLSHSGMTVSNDLASATRDATYLGSATQPASTIATGSAGPVLKDIASIPKDSSTGQQLPAAQKVRVAPGGVQGLVISRAAPLYPASARQAHIEGTVVLQALIGKDGSVLNVRVLSGHPMLIQAAVDAAKQWHFNPYYLDGEQVEADTQINVSFTLQGGD
jgi:TonB family protein